jgi:histidyl-tRNA synthetase
VGSNSLLNEVDLAMIYFYVFEALRMEVEIRINSRKLLTALAETCGCLDKITDITVAIDKLDKIGIEKVKEELIERGLAKEQISIIEKYLFISNVNIEKLNPVKEIFKENETGLKGIGEIEFILTRLSEVLISNSPNAPKNTFLNEPQTAIVFDPTLARGLNYYTGVIFEVKAKNVTIGSIGGGGRYDDLTGLFGVPNIPGVGISFGVDRIYDVMEELKLFPETVEEGTKVLFFNLGEEESKIAYALLQQLRSKGIASEIFHEPAKMDKQFKYAEKKNIPFVAIIGSKEIENKTATIKKLNTGQQQSVAFAELADVISGLAEKIILR